MLLHSYFTEEGEKISGSMQIAKGLFKSAKSGNVTAIKAIVELTDGETDESKALSKLYKALDKETETQEPEKEKTK